MFLENMVDGWEIKVLTKMLFIFLNNVDFIEKVINVENKVKNIMKKNRNTNIDTYDDKTTDR